MRSRRTWLLLSATLLGMTGPSQAQTYLPASGHVTTGQPVQAAGPDEAAFARLVEMQVALGWLADPAIFPHPLRARVHDSVLQVQGMVPDDATRDRVVAVAHVLGKIQVEDQLGRCPSEMPAPSGPAQDLHAAVQQAFKADWARRVHELSIRSDDLGIVVVRGAVPSMEEKLLVSQQLSQLPGCRAVKNEIQVWQLERQGTPQILVTADGSLTVPLPALTCGMRMVHTTAFQASQSLPAAPTTHAMLPATSHLPLAAPPRRSPTIMERIKNFWSRRYEPQVTERAMVQYRVEMPQQPLPNLVVEAEPEYLHRSTIVSRELPALRPQLSMATMPSQLPARRGNLVERATARWQAWRGESVPVLPAAPPVFVAAGSPLPTMAMSSQPTLPTTVQTRLVPIPVDTPKTLPPQATPERRFPAVPAVATTSPTAVHHTVFAQRPPAATPPEEGPLLQETPPRVVHATGAATPVNVKPAGRPAVATSTPAGRSKSPLEQQLELTVARLCGPTAFEVAVYQRSEESVLVCVKVHDHDAARQLAVHLLNQPELSRWRVYLKIQVVSA